MRHFYTTNTWEAPNWCPICSRETQWRILGGKPAFCLNVHPTPKRVEKPVEVEQPGLFDATKA